MMKLAPTTAMPALHIHLPSLGSEIDKVGNKTAALATPKMKLAIHLIKLKGLKKP